ncbi:hypothetical protein ACHAW6_006711 [Cyclotella cf. meneghiniana]
MSTFCASDTSKTPDHAPSSIKSSPPPLKQCRLPRHVARSFKDNAKCDIELSRSPLISILQGREVRTPTDCSITSNLESLFSSSDAEDSQDSNANDAMEENLADFEVAMFASNSRGVPNHSDLAVLDSSIAETSPPFFPRQEDFVASPTGRGRFTLTPKIKLFEDSKYEDSCF